MLFLRLLGCPTIEDAAGELASLASRRHPLALLALLATAPGKMLARGKLVGLLWPECGEQVARNRLNTCVHQVRSALGERVLRSSGDDIQFAPSALWCDVVEFEQAVAEGAYERAVGHYRGAFLDGFQVAASSEFEQCVDTERERLAHAYRAALEALAIAAEAAGQPETAAAWWRRRASEDHFDARVAQRLMEALDASGNRGEALRVARIHAQRLREEFGAPPDGALAALAARIASAGPAAVADDVPEHPSSVDGDGPEPYPDHAIAVLPFENTSGSSEVDPFTAGLHDDLLTELSRLRALTVIARTSVLRFRRSDRPVQEIARELRVGTLLEGTVQYLEGRLRVNVQLIDARTGGHRWAERYDRALESESVFEIQTELAERIAAKLREQLAPAGESAQGFRKHTSNLDARRLHARGSQCLLQLTSASVHHAVRCFRQAVACDPDYSLAWASLADALTTLDDYGYDAGGAALLAEAEAAARHALELSPGLAEAHASLGKLQGMQRRGPAAACELARAIELRPGYALAHNWLGWTQQCLGRPALALESARRAVELDPLSPEAVSNLAICRLAAGAPVDALRDTGFLREIAPEWPTGAFYEALVLYRLRRPGEALALLEGLSVPWAGNGPRCLLALALADDGQRARAIDMLASLDPFSAGLVHARFGDTAAAREAFDSVEDWGAYWPTLSVHQYFPDVWSQLGPVFEDVRTRVELAWGLEPRNDVGSA